MATITLNRNVMHEEVLHELGKITPSNPTHLSASVSYNAPVDEANAEVEFLEKQGYLVVKTYGNDWDCGQILRYALGEDKDEVVNQHVTQLLRCAVSPAIRNGDDLIIVDNDIPYEVQDYNWGKYGYTE